MTSIISVQSVIVSESDQYADFIVRLNTPSTAAITVNYATTDYTAANAYNYDYSAQSGLLTFAAGETTKTVRIAITDDTTAESVESFALLLSTPSANASLGNNRAIATIIDNDATAGAPSLSVTGSIVDESDGTASVTFRLDHAGTSVVTANYAVQGLTATQGTDYTLSDPNGLVSFAPGEVVKTVSFNIVNDTLTENAESFAVNVTGATGATISNGVAAVTIAANDGTVVAQPVITVADAICSENTGYIDFLVSLSAPSSSPISVNYQQVTGTASVGDYSSTSGTLVFAPGEILVHARIPVAQDTLAESLENFTFQLFSPVGGTLGKGSATGQIIDGNSALTTTPILTGSTSADVLQGTDAAESMSASDGNDVIAGEGGNDTMAGGLGDDIYVIGESGDIVQENANGGSDTVFCHVNYTLGNNLERLFLGAGATNGGGNVLDNTLIGNAVNNVLAGAAGNDTVNGGIGADTMYGGLGNDTFYRDNAADVMIENVGEGTDTIISSLSYTLGTNLENLVLAVGATNGGGNTLDNVMTGNAANNLLAGAAGNDTLDGGTGTDSLYGGLGNDTYYRDVSTDLVVENAGEGTDTAISSVSYTLVANVENLTLAGTATNGGGNALDNVMTGNALNNLLAGAAGNDTLDGGAGTDSMYGGLGNDTYYRDVATDLVVENTNEGTDTVISSVNYTLVANVENLVLNTGATNGGGNAMANLMTGNAANNVLAGAAGADTLAGGLGNDTLYGGTENDRFVFDTALNATTNVDLIADYSAGDQIVLDHTIFTALGAAGALSAAEFFAGAGLTGSSSAAQGAGIYEDTNTGMLYYDADGFGGAAAVKFAVVSGVPLLSSAAFVVS